MKIKNYTLNNNFIELLEFISYKLNIEYNIFDNFIFFYTFYDSFQSILFQFNFDIDNYDCYEFKSNFSIFIDNNNFIDFLLDIYNKFKE